ncbi:MAG: hypothetical protein AB2598_12835 [Candidatus Thiodiazotropha sp.]
MSVEQVLNDRFPGIFNNRPRLLTKPMLTLLRLLFHELINQLALYNVTIPTLFKQYTELCEPGGVCFLDFGKDPDFAGCTDGVILVSVDRVKAAKRRRYIGG